MKKVAIRTLLKRNLSKGQLLGYSVANLIGLTVILSGLQFYCDSRATSGGEDSLFSEDYIVISKRVKGVNLEPVAFTPSEIEELGSQPWVKDISHFSASKFPVDAVVSMGDRSMSSHLFMESVPDEFFDTKPINWEFDPSDKFVPIVLNKDYLALYNFGFALPQGLPQVSEEVIGSIPLKLRITAKDGSKEYFDASVVGFSSRLNTIAVPQEFMDWANARYAGGVKSQPSRMIIKIDRLDSASVDSFMKSHGYEIAGDKEGVSRLSGLMAVVSAVVSGIGLLISLLALFILILSISLLLQKSHTMLRNLLLLGYSPRQVGRYYELLVLTINSVIAGLGVGGAFLCRMIWHGPLTALGLGHGNVLPMTGCAVVYLVVITLLNIVIIRRHLNRLNRP